MTKIIKFPTTFRGIEEQREVTTSELIWQSEKFKELPTHSDRDEYYYKKQMEEEDKADAKEEEKAYWKSKYEGGSKSFCPFEECLKDKIEEELEEMKDKGVYDLERYKELIDMLKMKGGEDDV